SVGAHDLAPIFFLVREPDDDLVRTFDDVEIREHEPALVDDDAGAEARLAKLGTGRRRTFRAEELIEEILEEWIVRARRTTWAALHLRSLDRAEMHDGRTHVLGHAHETLLQSLGQSERWRSGRRRRRNRSHTVTQRVTCSGGR